MSVSPFARDDYQSVVAVYIADHRGIRVISDKKWNELPPNDQVKFKKFTVTLRALTWGETCDLQSSSSMVDKELNQRLFDPEQFIKGKLRKIIAAWDFTEPIGDQEAPVPLTPENIDSLHTAVANFLLDQYKARFEYDWEKEKNF